MEMPLPTDADLYMLTDLRTLAVFRLRPIIKKLQWGRQEVIFVRMHYRASTSYRESIAVDELGRFNRFTRHYGHEDRQVARIAMTRDRRVAELWQASDGSLSTWRQFRLQTRQRRRQVVVAEGDHYDRYDLAELDRLVTDLIKTWPRPDFTIDGLKQIQPGVWADRGATTDTTLRFLGPAWIGAGRQLDGENSVVGPAAIWDDEQARPKARQHEWGPADLTQCHVRTASPKQTTQWRRVSQRCFDVAFALGVLLLTLPLYPLIMLAIWLEDGGPFLFAHKRETVGGREFGCLKFRSMRKDAERIKAQIMANNQSDGPQFFIEDDPRVTRMGRFMRKTNLDEIPQFINVLMGDMSVVGPRPSPRKENQYSPAWREARLSVRPGITGWWQVCRTRKAGLDFQEWIKFDIEYVERASWKLDLLIIWRTLKLLAGK